MTISDLKAMYDYYHELRAYYHGELQNYTATSPIYQDYKERFEEAQNKYYNVGKQLEEAVEKAYEKEILK